MTSQTVMYRLYKSIPKPIAAVLLVTGFRLALLDHISCSWPLYVENVLFV